MDAVSNNAFFQWAGALMSPAVPLGDRQEVERDLLLSCLRHPEEAAAVMGGMLADLAMTLPHADAWRQLADRASAGSNADEYETYEALYDPAPGHPNMPWEWSPLPLDSCFLLACSFAGPEGARQTLLGLARWNPVDRGTVLDDRAIMPSEPGAGRSAMYSYGSRALLMLLHRRSVYDRSGTAKLVLDSARFWAQLVGATDDLATFKLPLRPELVSSVLP